MIRLILAAFVMFVYLVIFSPAIVAEWIIGKFSPKVKERSSLAFVRSSFRLVLAISGSKLTVSGRDNIPDDEAVLYVSNHRSYFDIIIGYLLIKGQCGFVSKPEIFSVPFLKRWMANLHCLSLDRDDIRAAFKTILAGIDLIKSGVSVWIFPEGSRNKGKGVMEFKEGSLKMAEKSGCPIIPVAMTGTAEIFEKHFPLVRPSKVTVTFGEPIYINKLSKEDKKFPGAYTRQKILDMLPEECKV